ncbi:HlyD family efflux transporter periplasmic adaptor subunit [Orbaceae bacterium ac157xtp]
MNFQFTRRKLIFITGIIIAIIIAVFAWNKLNDNGLGDQFTSGNGRLEATEIDISSKFAGRIESIEVDEGDFVRKGDKLATMEIQTLNAQLAEAKAQYQKAVNDELSAKAQITLRESDVLAAQALVSQRESELLALSNRFKRSQELVKKNALSQQQLDDDQANAKSAEAAVLAAKAQVASAEASVQVAKATAVGATSTIEAAQATINRIQADINDSKLVAPRDGRIQYRVAQPGEVLGAGGKVLNMIDLSDVYMTFFLPETTAGQVAIDREVHIVLDAFPQYVIPAKITYVASVAQFTPKTVETNSERQKLMFRVKAKIDKALLQKHIELVKTGLPGVAYIPLDPKAVWPAHLQVNVAP